MKVIVTADDFGLNPNRNRAILYAMQNNICTQASLIVNSPYTEEAFQLAYKNGYIHKVGLHLNLTFGHPLTQSILRIKKYCKDGMFSEGNPRSFRNVISLTNVKVIRSELEAQMKKFFDYGFTLRHIDSHNDILYNLPVWLALKPLLTKYKINSLRGIEPYLFGYYRNRNQFSYLPLKYYFLFFFKYVRIKNILILVGGRNINHFIDDYYGKYNFMRTGQISRDGVFEVIVHPDYDGENYIDRTNFDSFRNLFTLDNTTEKLKGFEKISYIDAYELFKQDLI